MAQTRMTLSRRIAALEQRQAPDATYDHLIGSCARCGKLRWFTWFESLPLEWFETDFVNVPHREIHAMLCECPVNRLSLALLQSIAAAAVDQ